MNALQVMDRYQKEVIHVPTVVTLQPDLRTVER